MFCPWELLTDATCLLMTLIILPRVTERQLIGSGLCGNMATWGDQTEKLSHLVLSGQYARDILLQMVDI